MEISICPEDPLFSNPGNQNALSRRPVPHHTTGPEQVLCSGGGGERHRTSRGRQSRNSTGDTDQHRVPRKRGPRPTHQRCTVIRACGFDPVPIISSRRLHSEQDRDGLLEALSAAAAPARVILVGGDPAIPAGPFEDSLALLGSGALERHSIRQVGIVGYPEGHPKIDTGTLWRCLKWKVEFLQNAGCSVEITTQFGFDADAVVHWMTRLRHEGIDTPVRIGVPGPASVGNLLRYAQRFGVEPSADTARRYGLSTGELDRQVGPERYWDQLTTGLDGGDFGIVLYHLYPFGGILEGVRWMNRQMPSLYGPSPTT